MKLFEQYRPTNYDDVVGQNKAIATLRRLESRGMAGRAVLLVGGTGTGKTTLARVLAKHTAEDVHVDERDAKGLTTADVDELARRHSTRPLFGSAYVVILNEVQGMNKAVLTKLLTAMESTPYTCWIFTTTCDNEEELAQRFLDWSAFCGRCNRVPLSQRGLSEAFARHARIIAQREGLDGQPHEKYVRLMKDVRNSLREALCRIEDGCML